MQQKMDAKESRKTAKLARPWALRTTQSPESKHQASVHAIGCLSCEGYMGMNPASIYVNKMTAWHDAC